MKLIDNLLGRIPKAFESERPRSAPRRRTRLVPRNQKGLKRFYMRGPLDHVVKTPWGKRSLARRRAKNKVAKQSRKVNRG